MISKKILASVGITSLVFASVASFAFAENSVTGQVSAVGAENAQKMVLEVGPAGKVLLRGTVVGTTTGTVTVKSWGGNWIVAIPATATLTPGTGVTVGDFVGVQGQMNTASPWTIDATLVRNWAAKKTMQDERQTMKTERHNNEQEIKNVIKNESPKNWQGTVSNINVTAKTFTLTVDGTAYAVTLVADATVVNQGFLKTDLTKVKDGDTVRVWGPVTGTTINAYVFRDVSLIATYDLKKGTR